MDLSTITVDQFKAKFYRDFYFANQNPTQQLPVPDDVSEIIQDLDITNGFADAIPLFNQGLFLGACKSGGNSGNANLILGFLYLSAHCMVLNIRAATAGGLNSSGTGGFPVSARSVGSVSESYTVPEAYADDPILAQYAQTSYGQKYLAMVLPLIRGNVHALWGGALP